MTLDEMRNHLLYKPFMEWIEGKYCKCDICAPSFFDVYVAGATYGIERMAAADGLIITSVRADQFIPVEEWPKRIDEHEQLIMRKRERYKQWNRPTTNE